MAPNTETCGEILFYTIHPRFRRKCPMACRETRNQGVTLRDVLRGWSIKGSVSPTAIKWCIPHQDVVRIIGFEELGNSDQFETATLELRLSLSGKFIVQY
jgi:hypothetical protein